MASINASTSGAGGVITTADSSGVLNLQSGGANVATINAYGIGLGTGVPSSGIGITFPSTQSASSDANTLDDYEEGTFTATMTSTGATIVLGIAQGYYTKIGNLVNVGVYISVSSVSGTLTNALILGGLPFTIKSNSNDGFGACFTVQTFTTPATAFTNPGTNTFNVYQQGTTTTIKANQISGLFYLYSAVYQTA
jgi:hypothetical protein